MYVPNRYATSCRESGGLERTREMENLRARAVLGSGTSMPGQVDIDRYIRMMYRSGTVHVHGNRNTCNKNLHSSQVVVVVGKRAERGAPFCDCSSTERQVHYPRVLATLGMHCEYPLR